MNGLATLIWGLQDLFVNELECLKLVKPRGS